MEDVKQLALKAAREEKKLAKLQEKFALQSPEFAKFLKKQKETNDKIADMWNQVKQALVDAEYFDVIENDNFKISVSKVLNFDADVDKLPEDYTETIKVPIKDKIKKHFELYGELPVGATDTSYFRLNKKVK